MSKETTDISAEIRSLYEKLGFFKHETTKKVIELVKPYLTNSDLIDIKMGFKTIGTFWKCEKSPFGLCMYDNVKDRVHDNCLFCHEPEERK